MSASVEELYGRLENAGVLVRIDPEVEPTCYAGAIISDRELQQLRKIRDVVRLGWVHRIDANRITLDDGEIETSPDTLHIHCATQALGSPMVTEVFDGNRITLQNLRCGLLPLSAAIIGFVEATRTNEREKNAPCHPFRYTGVAGDWMRQRLADLENGARWRAAPDLIRWMDGERLSMNAGMVARREEPGIASSVRRIRDNAAAATDILRRLSAAMTA
jgi:hypothetical protein